MEGSVHGVALADLGCATSEAAYDGFRRLIIKCDPANHKSKRGAANLEAAPARQGYSSSLGRCSQTPLLIWICFVPGAGKRFRLGTVVAFIFFILNESLKGQNRLSKGYNFRHQRKTCFGSNRRGAVPCME